MSQNNGGMKMSHNFVYGDIVRVGKGKVEYTVAEVQTAPEGSVTVQSNNTGKFSDVEASRLSMVQAFVPLSVAQSVEEVATMQDTEEDFDPRQDRRQSAYGLAILAEIFRRNPNAARMHNRNPLKPIGSKRAKVRRRVRQQRTAVRLLSEEYNTMVRDGGYTPNAA